MSDFPSVRDVTRHVEQAANGVLRWTGDATSAVGPNPALSTTIQTVLASTFAVCKGEVTKRLNHRLRNFKVFLGDSEPVTLAGDGSMNLDTQEVMYQTLRGQYTTLVPTDHGHMNSLAGTILKHAMDLSADPQLAQTMIFNLDNAGESFQRVMKSYLDMFVQVSEGASRVVGCMYLRCILTYFMQSTYVVFRQYPSWQMLSGGSK